MAYNSGADNTGLSSFV